MITITCQRCQQSFEAVKRFARFCIPCRKARDLELKHQRRANNPPAFRVAGFACDICCKQFTPLTRREKYCGEECYKEARRRQAKTPEQRARGARKQAAKRARDPDHAHELAKRSREKHADKRNAENREWRRRHLGYEAEHSRKWRALHPEKKRQEGSKYYQANKDKISARISAYMKAHPELRQARNSRRRAWRKNAEGSFTAAEFLKLCEQCNWHCAYCHQRFDKLTPDHILPLSRGGSNDVTNIIPACASCNYSKQDKTPLEYISRYLPLMKAA